MSARPLRDFSPYYAISAAYNSPIMHNGRLTQRRALKWRHYAKNINNVRAIKWRRYVKLLVKINYLSIKHNFYCRKLVKDEK